MRKTCKGRLSLVGKELFGVIGKIYACHLSSLLHVALWSCDIVIYNTNAYHTNVKHLNYEVKALITVDTDVNDVVYN